MKTRPSTSSSSSTVRQALARAEAWAERATILSYFAFEVTDLFDASAGREPRFLIPRFEGGATSANPRNVENLRLELFAAANEAREEARAIMASAAAVVGESCVPALHGRGAIAAAVEERFVELPTSIEDPVANPRSPWARSARDAAAEPMSDEESRAIALRHIADQREGRFG